MGWSIGYDKNWDRDVGYGVPAFCDHPGCYKTIDRGLSYVCGGDMYGGEYGCGLYFCGEHLFAHKFRGSDGYHFYCKRCIAHKPAYKPKPEHPEWLEWKLTDPSWENWRQKNPNTAQAYKQILELTKKILMENTTNKKPKVGMIVLYTLSELDAECINRRRVAKVQEPNWIPGAQAHFGNPAYAGDVLPLIISKVFPEEFGPNVPGINGQIMLDGNDTLWVTSVKEGQGQHEWRYAEE